MHAIIVSISMCKCLSGYIQIKEKEGGTQHYLCSFKVHG